MQHILLLVTYQTKPNTREAFVEEVTDLGILQKIQKEDGFVAYQYYYDATDANTLLLVEEWESEAKQQAASYPDAPQPLLLFPIRRRI